MTPISLSLQNFLSYGEGVPTLDFTGFHVACISGRNGHGKSALLDAITWALWGEARKAGIERRPNEGLLRIGATEMRVDFEFHFEGNRYRVSRNFRKSSRAGTTRLELQVYSPETGGYKTLSEEDSVRKTQDRLNALLRMTYETFINSAFLLQGRADEFTRKNARERKAILSEILGLTHYDELSVLARNHALKAEQESVREKAKIAEIDAAIAEKETLAQGIDALKTRLSALETDIEQAETRLEILREMLARRERLQGERDGIATDLTRLSAECTDAQTQIDTTQKEIDACREIIERRETLVADLETHRQMQAEASALQDKLHALRPLEQRAGELARDIDKARHEVERRLGEWNLRIEEAHREIAEAETLLQDREDVEARIQALHQAREQNRQWENLREQRDMAERAVRDLERRVETVRADLQIALNTHRDHLRRSESLAADIGNRRAALEKAQRRLEDLKAIETDRDRVRDQGSALNAQIDAHRHRLDALKAARADLHTQQAALETAHSAQCPLCGSALNETHRAEVRARLDGQLKDNGEAIQNLERALQTAETERETLRRHYQELKNQLAEGAQAARITAESQAALQEAQKAEMEAEGLRRDIAETETRLKIQSENSPDARALSQARQALEALPYNPAEHRTLREKLKDLETVETRRAQLQAAEERLSRTRATLPEFEKKRDLAQQWLSEERYAVKEREAWKNTQAEIHALNYDAERHKTVAKELNRLKDAPTRHERLQAAQREMAAAQQRLDTAQVRLHLLQTQREQASRRLPDLETAIAETRAAVQESESLRQALRRHREARDQIVQERAGFLTRHARCEALEGERPSVQAHLQTAEHDLKIYRELVTALGKDGIQALIIEQAIPEIETEANRILSRLTGNRTQIAIESLRDLKKGGTRETLDIKISDELGERSYELYSGGEAFRVDFAVRIALSKLLSTRAGTRLRTLVIDEGFGTQDAEGLENLVEAIQAIAEDFEKILVITHVESLKQAFPVRIDVTKYPDLGSRFEVLY